MLRCLGDYRRPDDRRALLEATAGDCRRCIGDAGHDASRSGARRRRRTGAAGRPLPDPAALVHPLDGTGTGPVNPGTVGEFPGADVPFGMMQWSPDTYPDAVQAGGGYAYTDSRINGFSLTHLSGTGCPSYQDVPILPTEGDIGNSPQTTRCLVLARAGAGQSRSVPGQARSHLDRRRARRHDAYRHRPICLSIGHAVQHPLQGGGQREPRLRLERANRRPRPSRGSGHQRGLLPDRHELHAPLRRAVQPTLLVGRELDRFGRSGGAHQLCGYIVRGVRAASIRRPSAMS